MKKFSGGRVLLGCCLYVFIAMGTMAIYVTSMARLPDAYGISITLLGTLGTLMPVTCMAGSVLLVTIKARLGARGCLYLGSVVVFVQTGLLALLRQNIVTLLFTLFTGGLVAALCAQTVMTDILSHWFIEKRAQKVAIMLGCAPFGSAFYQMLSGQVFERLDYFTGMILLSGADAVLMLLIARFLIIGSTPEEAGQRPLGADTAAPETPAESAAAANPEGSAVKTSLYRNPAFFFLLIATMLAAGNITYVQSYATMFFTRSGIAMGVAAAILSGMSVCSALFSFCSGKVLEKLQVLRFTVLLVAAAVTANLSMVLYSRTGFAPVILLTALTYGVGGMIPMAANLFAGQLFGSRDAVNAASKCYAAYSGTNIVLQPICAAIVDNLGFEAVYCFIAALCALSMLFYLLAVRKAGPQ